MANQKKVALLILDGWGYGNKSSSDAIFNAKTPVFDSLIDKYANSTLLTDGENVGLPKGQMGNSEVGHLNIGAGRVVYQDLVKINKNISEDKLRLNTSLQEAFNYAKEKNKPIHFIGLLSDGGIHSHQSHLYHLIELANEFGIQKSFVHAFLDGRDTDPKSGLQYIQSLQNKLANTPTKLASIIGRYYSMDRDLRWERIKEAYDLLINGKGEKSRNISATIKNCYENNITDEFMSATVIADSKEKPIAKIKNGDVVLCFNFRTDRCREITRVLSQENLPEYGMQKLDLNYLTMTNYDDNFKNVSVLFKKDNLTNTLGEVISKAGLNQIRIAETEKYPHVTFFFSGGREMPFDGERRIMENSPKVATYDLQPEMSADQVKVKILKEIEEESAEFICLNFANPDMVGHTGVYKAIIKAVEKVDDCLGQIIQKGKEHDYSFIIIADHGNADYVINEDGSPNTAHSTNPVPVILIDEDYKTIRNGKLADVAPTILKIMGINIPKEMDGEVLV